MSYVIDLIERQLAKERGYRRDAIRLLNSGVRMDRKPFEVSLSLATERVPELRRARNILLFGQPRWYSLRHRIAIGCARKTDIIQH